MAIAPTKSAGLEAALPAPAVDSQGPANYNPVVLEIAGDGAYSLNSERLTHALLHDRLADVFARRAERVLFLKAAGDLEFGVVADAIDIAHEASVDRVALMPKN